MFAPDDTAQTTDAFEQLPRTQVHSRRSASPGRRQHLREQQTDTLSSLSLEHLQGKAVGRQVALLREQNRQLRTAYQEQSAEMQRLVEDYKNLKAELGKEVAIIDHGHQQEVEYYQGQYQELQSERERLLADNQKLEQRFAEIQQVFQDTVEEEARRLMTEVARAAVEAPATAPTLIQDVVKTVELYLRKEEDKHLAETLYLKREVQRMAAVLEQERQELQEERQRVLTLQLSARKQATLRHKTLHERLRLRWRLASAMTSLGLLALFIVLQFVFLAFFHVHLIGPVALSIISPIVICILLAIALAAPLDLIKRIYTSAPHKKKVKQ